MDDKNVGDGINNNTDTESVRMPEENLMVTSHSHMGPILGALIVVLVLILGGFYLWGSSLSSDIEIPIETQGEPFNNSEPETPRAAADAQIFETLSPSDEINAIEADLESTNLDSLGSELIVVERELDTALQDQ
jgi:hypothetical protein